MSRAAGTWSHDNDRARLPPRALADVAHLVV
jgi:hypothetical protein